LLKPLDAAGKPMPQHLRDYFSRNYNWLHDEAAVHSTDSERILWIGSQWSRPEVKQMLSAGRPKSEIYEWIREQDIESAQTSASPPTQMLSTVQEIDPLDQSPSLALVPAPPPPPKGIKTDSSFSLTNIERMVYTWEALNEDPQLLELFTSYHNQYGPANPITLGKLYNQEFRSIKPSLRKIVLDAIINGKVTTNGKSSQF
jgi:hypothetical protein